MNGIRFSQILDGIPHEIVAGSSDAMISGLSYDSRECAAGCLFFCVRGLATDGHRYIPDALAKGAAALVVEEAPADAGGAAVARVADSRTAMARISAKYYGEPSASMRLAGVTGTNGKTSIAYLVDALMRERGNRTGMMGTVENRIGDEVVVGRRTTPESLDLQAMLARMRDGGCSHATMEVSSHAVALGRIEGCAFDAGIFSNMTQDHLDFHMTMENYFDAKKMFFHRYLTKKDSVAVLNGDDPFAARIREGCPARVVEYGVNSTTADVRGTGAVFSRDGTRFRVESRFAEAFDAATPLMGPFNLYNALAMVAYGLGTGCPVETIQKTLSEFRGVPGRFERVDEGQKFTVIVDYAHTPDGLNNVLRAARNICRGRLIVIFGAGGDRDRTKRPLMGAEAGRGADFVIVTSDNPRTEDPAAILADVAAGVNEALNERPPAERFRMLIEEDRREAIRKAVFSAREDDVIVIAGKGHEDYQIFRDRTIHFDDREEARKSLKELMGNASDTRTETA